MNEGQARLDKAGAQANSCFMQHAIQIDARWDDEAHVWIATSAQAPGLVVEAASWQSMIDEVRVILPELLELDGATSKDVSLTFKAETRLALAAS